MHDHTSISNLVQFMLRTDEKCNTIHLTEKSSSVCLITENVSLKY